MPDTLFDKDTVALLKLLTEALRIANTADADGVDMPEIISSQHGAYGHIHAAITSVVNAHGMAMPSEVNWCGHGSTWYDDLVYELTHI